MANSQTLLQAKSISVSYGLIPALKEASFEVYSQEIVAVIGANGAGKTTTLRAISGLVKPSTGTITFQGQMISGLPPHELVRLGMSHVPEGRGVFLNLSVEENLDLGAWVCSKSSQGRRQLKDDFQYAYELFPRLKERRLQSAGTLSGGELQMLALARALMAHPKLLLLDEPSLGLAPQMIEKIFEMIQKINQQGMTVLLVEQNARQALEIAHRGLVLETGRLVRQASAKELLHSDEIRKAYLGA